MASNLTISLDEEIIEAAEKYAASVGKSLSEIIEDYLRYISKKQKEEREVSPEIRKLKGSVPLPENIDYEDELTKVLFEKHVK